jgi:hypothetical protein
MNYDQKISEIEFMTSYPKADSPKERVFLAIVLTDKNRRVLVYAPSVTRTDMEIRSENDIEEYGYRGKVLGQIVSGRKVIIGTEMYVITNADTCFSVFELDEYAAPRVQKKDIEKLFKCVIVDG